MAKANLSADFSAGRVAEGYDAVVVGSGAAGYSAACRLQRSGTVRVLLMTEGILCGTSRNTGSDKQTYYKLSVGGSFPDSPRKMAEDLFSCGAVDGDTALCEAALSVRGFLHLCEIGVPFPVDSFGEYIGYKTDHDPAARATSAGPLTSRYMTEALEEEAAALGVPVADGLLAIEVLVGKDGVCGLLALEQKSGETVLFRTPCVVLATGGPAGVYADTVYPAGQHGSSSLALRAGASMQNLTEWQYGLSSVSPRWNVSGTYMQALPRFFSVGADGAEHEFLSEFFRDPYEALSAVFLKGYQWPFDVRRVRDGSSVIDLLVYRETVLRRRRVFLDYTKNAFGLSEIDFSRLSPEASGYLCRAGGTQRTPIGRLAFMNRPAVELYRSKGADLFREPLEIALCAQHHNGGIAVDAHWQTSVPGLYAVGECAGTHGVTRPGGSALNAGQAGALRAAEHIRAEGRQENAAEFNRAAASALQADRDFRASLSHHAPSACSCAELTRQLQRRMSDCAGAIRDPEKMRETLSFVRSLLFRFPEAVAPDASGADALVSVYRLRDLLYTSEALLFSMLDYASHADGSRGSALCRASDGMGLPGLGDGFPVTVSPTGFGDCVQEVAAPGGILTVRWRPVRPIPPEPESFETVWREFRGER